MTAPIIVAYWLDQEITNTFPCPPLRNMGDLKQPSGQPQISVVNIMCAGFNGTQTSFKPPYINLSASTLKAFANGDVQHLQSQGIKVVLTVMSNDSIGWSSIPASFNQDFAAWVKSDLIDKYGLDGIDIDDENFNSGMSNPQYLIPTVSALRSQLPSGQYLITKALWQDTNCFGSRIGGNTLAELLDFGSSMTYGDDLSTLESTASVYTGLPFPLTTAQICVGIQPGPTGNSCASYQFTSLETAKQAALWAKSNNYLGVMIYSYSQDITAFTSCPQHGPYPSDGDHFWQLAITSALYGLK